MDLVKEVKTEKRKGGKKEGRKEGKVEVKKCFCIALWPRPEWAAPSASPLPLSVPWWCEHWGPRLPRRDWRSSWRGPRSAAWTTSPRNYPLPDSPWRSWPSYCSRPDYPESKHHVTLTDEGVGQYDENIISLSSFLPLTECFPSNTLYIHQIH